MDYGRPAACLDGGVDSLVEGCKIREFPCENSCCCCSALLTVVVNRVRCPGDVYNEQARGGMPHRESDAQPVVHRTEGQTCLSSPNVLVL